MREITLQAEIRSQVGKGSRALRREGKVPGIYYIHGEPNIPLVLNEKSLKPLIFTSETHIIDLKLSGGESKSCILREFQFDPVTERPIHFDFQGLRENEEISVEVPVTVTGAIPLGVRDGGILQQIVHKIKIMCLPRYIPEHIEVNAENLKINSFIHIRDLKIENVKFLGDEDSSIVGVVPPTVEKEVVAGTPAAEEAVEPEVIGKGKKPEEGAEAEGAEKKGDAKKADAKKSEAAPPAKDEKKK